MWKMPLFHIQTINHELNRPLLIIISTFTFQWESHWTILPSIACKSTIAPNKQRLEHNNLATNHEAKVKGAYAIHEPPIP